jgi:P4 family phage/plasmid primase-like protien
MFKNIATQYMSLNTTLETPKQRTILIVDNVENGLAVHMAHYKTIAVCNDYRAFRNADELITFFNSDSMKYGSHRRDYKYLLCCGKYCNDKLSEYMKKEGLTYDKDAWKWYRKLDSGIFSTDRTSDLEKVIDSHVLSQMADDSEAKLLQFCVLNKDGKIITVDHNKIFEHIRDNNDMCIYGGVIWLYGNGIYKPDISGITVKDMIRQHIPKSHRRTNTINTIYGLFFTDKSLLIESFNQYPKYWACFNNCMVDGKTGDTHEHNPKYYCTNQIPWDYDTNISCKGEAIEEFIHQSILPEDVKTVWQILGLCLVPDNSFQKAVILQGCGGSGKSTLLAVLSALIGRDNISNLTLQDLEEKFHTIQLLSKLANICGDLDKTALKSIATFKKVTGGDALTDSFKGKDLVTFVPYARLIFSANEIPLTLDEKSNAFFRRLIIIKMDNKPLKPDNSLSDKLVEDMPYIIVKALQALQELYREGAIHESGSSKKLVQELYEESDSVEAFLKARTIKVEGAKVKTTEMYQEYKKYCDDEDTKRTPLSRNEFYRNMKSKCIGKKVIKGAEYFAEIGLIAEGENPPPRVEENPPSDGFNQMSLDDETPYD